MTTLYFLQAGDRIKIGITKNLRTRISELQRQNGHGITVIGTVEGSWLAERHLHETLALYRLHGEWFSNCPEVRAVINRTLEHGAPVIELKQKKNQKPFVPGPSRPYHEMLSGIVALMWPHEGLKRLSEFSEQPEEVCRKWLSGEEKPPRLIRAAFASEVIHWMFSPSNNVIKTENVA